LSKQSLRQRIIRVQKIKNKHHFVVFGKPVKGLSRFSAYLRSRDLTYQSQQKDKELKSLGEKLAALESELAQSKESMTEALDVHQEQLECQAQQENKKLAALSEELYLLDKGLKEQNDSAQLKALDEKIAQTKTSLTTTINANQAQFKKRVLHNGIRSINKERIASKIENFKMIGIQEEPSGTQEPRIVVSLTSCPDNLYDIHYCLYSLLNQALKPHKLILWLADEQFPNKEEDVPQKVLDLKEHGLSIAWCSDIKGYKKIIPALKKYPNDIIVIANDNVYYEQNWLEALVSAHDGRQDIICHRAYRVMFEDEKVAPMRKWIKGVQTEEASVFNFPITDAGVLYPPHSLHADVLNEELSCSIAPDVGDTWLWVMALRAKRKIRVISVEPNDKGIIESAPCYVNPEKKLGIDDSAIGPASALDKDAQIATVIEACPEIQEIFSEHKRPLVSVIVPVYNTAEYLQQCLNSAVKQTLRDIEIICVNDGSTDASLTILQSYAAVDPRIRIIDQPNKGYGHALNIGIAHATGEYIAFLDSDDYITTSAYEKLYRAARCRNVDIIKANYFRVFSGEKAPPKKKDVLTKHPDLYNKVLNPRGEKRLFYVYMSNCVGLLKRSFVEENTIVHRENPGCVNQDFGFWFQTFMYAKRVFLLKDHFYCYRQDRPGSSRNNLVTFDRAEEYDHIWNILQSQPGLVEEFSDVFWHRRYTISAHLLNLLPNNLKEKFIHVLSKDFGSAQQSGELNLSRFSDLQHKHLHMIIENPGQYYTSFFASPEEVTSYRMPTVSVIVPVYNSEPYLKACLDSILGQTFKNIEVICVNDGSTDGSLEILNNYAGDDPRITVISQKNAGAGAARNVGLKVARGTYLSFLDSDDIFYKTLLEKMLLESLATQADICVCDAHRYDNETQQTNTTKPFLKEKFLPTLRVFDSSSMQKDIFYALGGYVWNKLFNRDFINNNEIIFQEIERSNDIFFAYIALVLARHICTIKEPLILYRTNNKTSLQGTKYLFPLDFYHARKAIKEEFVVRNVYDQFKHAFVNTALLQSIGTLNSFKGTDTHQIVWTALKSEVFQALDVVRFEDTRQALEYYYPELHYAYREMLLVLDLSYEEYCAYKGI